MAYLEKEVFIYIDPPKFCLRFDDILILVLTTNKLHNIQLVFLNNSILSFIYELSRNNKLPSLDRHQQ